MNRFAIAVAVVAGAAAAAAALGPPVVPPPVVRPGPAFVPPPPKPAPVFLFPAWLPAVLVPALVAHQAEVKRRQEEEEETMTPTETPAVEFKFLRASGGAFKDAAKFRAALAAEAAAGWELHEKLCDTRVRLRRAVAWRDKDGELGWDAYRTRYGPSEAAQTLKVLGIVFGVLIAAGAAIGLIFALK